MSFLLVFPLSNSNTVYERSLKCRLPSTECKLTDNVRQKQTAEAQMYTYSPSHDVTIQKIKICI